MNTVTPGIEAAESALDEFGGAVFRDYHSVTDDGEYSLYTTVGREFDVAELMTGLGIDVAPEYEFRPSPFVAMSDRVDYEAAYALSNTPEPFWEWRDVSDIPAGLVDRDEYDDETLNRALCILRDSSAMSDLLADYFALEQVAGEADAAARLSEYMRLLDAANRAYRAAGWEL